MRIRLASTEDLERQLMDLFLCCFFFGFCVFGGDAGYASHLAALAAVQCRPSSVNPYLLLPRGCMSLPGHGAPLLRRRFVS